MDRFASRGKLSYAIVEYAAQPFAPANWHWASVLVLQRLMTAMCAALSTTGVESSVTVALISLLFLLLHLLVQPYRSNWVNILQGCANVCLVVLAILNSASGAFLSTGFDPHADGSPTLQHFQTALEVLMLFTLFPTPLVYIWHMSASLTCSCCRSRGKKPRHEQARNSFRAKSPETVQRRGQWEDEGVTEPSVEASELDHEERQSASGQLILDLQPQPQHEPMIEPDDTRPKDWQWEKQQLEREKREMEREKRELEREKQVQGQRHTNEKQQLEREKQQLEQEKQQLEREKQQLEREKQQLERVYPKMTSTKGGSSNRPLYRTFEPDPDAAC
jgi:hypothetical protein